MNWSEHKAPDGRSYWYNKETKKSRWDKPEELKSKAEKIVASVSDWKEYTAPDGRPYWYNAVTKNSVWEMPAEYQQLLERVQEPLQQPAQQQVKSELISPVVQFDTHEEAENAFIQMLKDQRVTAEWTWERVVRQLHGHQMYRALQTATERKEAFEKFLERNRALELKLKYALEQQQRDDFLKMLESYTTDDDNLKLTFMSSYAKLEHIFSQRQEWSALQDQDRRKLFQDHLSRMRSQDRDTNTQLRSKLLSQLDELFSTVDILTVTTWEEFLQLPQAYELFMQLSEQACQVEMLKSFERRIIELRRTESQALKGTDPNESILFSSFRNLLQELHEKGHLSVDTLWKELYVYLAEDSRYCIMFEHELSSTPLDLYRDFIVELEDRVYRDGQQIQSILRQRNVKITKETSFQQFKAVIDSKDQNPDGNMDSTMVQVTNCFNEHSLQVVYDILMQKVSEKSDSKKRRMKQPLEAQHKRVKETEEGELSS